jgi:hypothetical protein
MRLQRRRLGYACLAVGRLSKYPVLHETQALTVVGRDIKNEEEFQQVRRALVACPFHAVQFTRQPKMKVERPPVNEAYPMLIDEDVYLLGHFTPDNAGACCWLIKRCAEWRRHAWFCSLGLTINYGVMQVGRQCAD